MFTVVIFSISFPHHVYMQVGGILSCIALSGFIFFSWLLVTHNNARWDHVCLLFANFFYTAFPHFHFYLHKYTLQNESCYVRQVM